MAFLSPPFPSRLLLDPTENHSGHGENIDTTESGKCHHPGPSVLPREPVVKHLPAAHSSALPELGEGLRVTGEEAAYRAITYLLKEPEQEAGWAGT